ncbi:MAG: hypothetical protein K2J20_02640, partial [Bacilli bacterium]|nr:hypothetical protein [Bacilli bacterium]
MMKKIADSAVRIVLIGVLAVVLLSPMETQAVAKTLGDLKNIYNELLAEKRANDNKTQEAKDEIKAKENAIKKAEEDISAAEEDITAAEYEQLLTEEKIKDSNDKIGELKKESENILLYMQQMQSQNVYVEYVSGATSVTEMIMRIEAVKQITSYIRETTDNLEVEIENNEKLKKELEEKQENLNKQIAKHQDAIASYQTTIAKLHNNIEEYDKYALGINEKVQQAKENYEQNKKICKQNIGKDGDSVLLSDCTRVPASSGWLKPLNYGVTTSTIGARWGSYHNALDIGGNSEGTPVYAAAAGKVVGKIYKYRCGGNMLYIDVTVKGVNYTTCLLSTYPSQREKMKSRRP